jgi:uncharacterized membrane protein YedE/YeeE
MKQTFTALFSGLLFGVGLILSGMSNPAKVLDFLDITGPWDPSLLFVMAGAITIASIAFTVIAKRDTSLLQLEIHIPTTKHINKRLVLGSMTFGIGWGLAGICPGPALVLLGAASSKGILFTIAMLVGMAGYELLETWRLRHTK